MRHPSSWPTYAGLAVVLAGLVGLNAATQDPGEPPETYGPVLSADGSTVVFRTRSLLTLGDRNYGDDVYAKRLDTGELTLVSGGLPGPDRYEQYALEAKACGKRPKDTSPWWWAPDVEHSTSRLAVSGDGRHVAFISCEPGLVPGDTNRRADVFVRDMQTRTLRRVSTAADGTQATGASGGTLALSGDGRKLAFLSTAADLVPGDTNSAVDAFVKDLVTGALTRVSTTSDGGQLRHGADIAGLALSADGSTAAFATRSPEVTGRPPGPEVTVQIVAKDLRTGEATWVTETHDGRLPDRDSADPALSADGSVLAFVSRAMLRREGTGRTFEAFDAYVRDLRTQRLVRVSGLPGAGRKGGVAPGIALSADGTRVALTRLLPERWVTRTRVLVVDLRAGTVRPASEDPRGSYGYDVSLSADGERLAWADRKVRLRDVSDGRPYDVVPAERPSYWSRLSEAAIPDPVSPEPVWRLFPWGGG